MGKLGCLTPLVPIKDRCKTQLLSGFATCGCSADLRLQVWYDSVPILYFIVMCR